MQLKKHKFHRKLKIYIKYFKLQKKKYIYFYFAMKLMNY